MGDFARERPRASVNAAASSVEASIGKRTLVEQVQVPVQRIAASAPSQAVDLGLEGKPGAVEHAAAQGVRGGSTRLPHVDRIQQLFGRHDVSHVQAHIGGDAAEASERMGAQAYAMGDHVAFHSAPDLHTAAHEAAHVVQQRAGVQLKDGVGRADDAYEANADRVADLVVKGESAEHELSRIAAGSPGGAAPAVQRRLRLTGKRGDRQRVLAVMNKGLFGYRAEANAKGDVKLIHNRVAGPPSKRNDAMHDYLSQIIRDPKLITVRVDSGSSETVGGSYATGHIDIADIEALAGNSGLTDTGSLIHELVEQYHKQAQGMPYGGERTGAHHQGIVAENGVNGSVRGPQHIISATQNPDGTLTATIDIPYTFPSGRIVTTRLIVVHGEIVRAVDRETRPAS